MSVAELHEELTARGIELWLDGGQVRYRGPAGALTPALLAKLRLNRTELAAWLQAEEAKPFPLTSGQRALWFLHRKDPDSPAYHIRFTVELVENAVVSRINAAMRVLVNRHPMLRSFFGMQDGQPVQFIRPHMDWKLNERVLTPGASPHSEADEPFDLQTGPVCRITLFRRAGMAPLLQISAHHIMFDFAALEILIVELRALYQDPTAPLPPLSATFRAHAEAEKRRLSSEEGERLRRFWKSELSTPLPVLELPGARPRSAVQTWNGDTWQAEIPADLTAGLKELARAEGATLYSVLLAAWQLLLFRHTHKEDLITGTPVSGRDRPELEAVVGYFANAIPIRMRFAPAMTFRDLLAVARQRILDAIAHGSYPLPTMLEDLQIERDSGRPALFQSTFVWDQRNEGREPGYPGDPLYTGHFSSEQRGANYDLSLTIYDVAGPLRMALAYNRDLFDSQSITGLADRFRHLLRSIIADSNSGLDYLGIGAPPRITTPLPQLETATVRSFHQNRLWFIDQFESGKIYPGPPTYHNLIGWVRVEGELDVELLRAALASLRSRHDVLREVGEELPFTTEPWTEEALEREREKPFRLGHEAPARAALFSAQDSSVVALVLHHYAADAWTARLLVEEWMALYAGRPLPAAIPYPAYAARQQAMTDDELDILRRYWFHLLRGRLQPLVLPYDSPRAPIHVFRAGVVNFTAQASHAQETKLLSAFVALLRRYSGQDEIVIGVTDAGREGFETLAGPVSNLLVLRVRVDEETTLGALEGQVREAAASAQAHRDFPFDRLVMELNPPIDMSRTALFDVLFSFNDCGDSPVEVGPVGFGKYDLHLYVTRNVEGTRAQLVFNRELFDDRTAEAMATHWGLLVDAFADPTLVLDDVPLRNGGSDQQPAKSAEVSWPRTATITSLFSDAAKRSPHRIAVTSGSRTMSYRELDERSNHLAARLLAAGVHREELVALLLDRDESIPVCVLGVLKAGAAYLPLDPTLPPARIAMIAADAGCRRIVVSAGRAAEAPGSLEVIELINDPGQTLPEPPPIEVGPANLAYCIFTSGSTGKPKGVLLEHRHVVRLFFNDAPLFDFSERDVWTLFHSCSFDFSVWEMFGALLFGGRLVVVPSQTTTDPAAMVELLHSERVTVLNQTPPAFGPLANECLRQRPDLDLRIIVFGGQQLDPARLQAWHAQYPAVKLVNMYGITETCVHVTYREIIPADMQSPFSPIGRPIPTMETCIVDRRLRPVPRGIAGELLVGGAGVARGYLNRVELTLERFIPHPLRRGDRVYRSGDRVRELANGDLIYEGRIDEQMQVRGFRVELGEIRCALLKQPAVADVHVGPWGPPGEERIVAWIVPRLDLRQTKRRMARFRREDENSDWLPLELPNGMMIASRNPSETEFTYDEIFEQNSYLRHGVHLRDGAVIIDAGANIGMFSLFAATACRDARVIALEPIPQTYSILRVNGSLYDFRIEVIECGVASREQLATFTHYPAVSIFSGRYADAAQERDVIGTFIYNQARQNGETPPTAAEIDAILNERFRGEPVECRLRTISQIVRERRLDRVDLLKLDVERSELDALRGIEESDWPKIRQIVIETHGGPEETGEIAGLLRTRGFNVAVEQEHALEHTSVSMLFAVRDEGCEADVTHIPTRANPMPNSAPALVRELRLQLRRELPEYMIPGAIVLINGVPLNSNGKVDPSLLPSPDRTAAATSDFVAPRGPVEQQVAHIISEVLAVQSVGAFDSFFDLGGHSLLVMRAISRLRLAFNIDFPVHAIFENPTIAAISTLVEELRLNQRHDMEPLLAELEELSEEEVAERISAFGAAPGGMA
jgi:amino acid adenylation domain-containing protein/FkbM family methyltransferase